MGEIERFKNLEFVLQNNDGFEVLKYRIKCGWIMWKVALGILCDRRIPFRLEGKFYKLIMSNDICITVLSSE